MACLDYTGPLKLLYDWQTLVAGFVAIGGGWLAYFAGVKQVRAIRAQTAVLRQQNDDLKRAEQRRLARDSLIAARMLDASLEVVARDIENARSTFGGPRDGYVDEPTANLARQAVGKPGFAYLWEKVGILDREIAVPFLELEASIDRMRAQHGTTHIGPLTDRLDHLSALVERIRDLAGGEIRRTRAVLSDDDIPPQ